MAMKTAGPSKSDFIRDFIRENRAANQKAVEQAWHEAGHEGSISSALVSTIRRELGLIGTKRDRSRPPGSDGAAEALQAKTKASKPRRRGRRRKGEVSDANSTPATGRKPSSRGPDRALAEIEQDLDRLVFKVMTLGGFGAIEHELRKVRRLLYHSAQA
jgi:hypothetical protein